MGVGIPEQFHDLRPAGGFLDFIDHQQSSLGVIPGFDAGEIPLLLKPCLVAEGGFVRGGVVRGKPRGFHDLPGQRGFSYLSRTRQNLDETARLAKPGKQLGVELGALHWIYSGQ